MQFVVEANLLSSALEKNELLTLAYYVDEMVRLNYLISMNSFIGQNFRFAQILIMKIISFLMHAYCNSLTLANG